MSGKKFIPGTAVFCIAIGIFNILLWLILIFTGSINETEKQLTSFIFHWISEIGMALILIIAGYKIFQKHKNARSYFYLGMGFMINAVQGAAWYYYLNPDIKMIAVMLLILAAGIYFSIVNYRLIFDLFVMAFGMIIYSGLNFIGNSLQDKEYTYLIYTIPVFVLVLFLLPYLLKFKIRKLTRQ